MGLNSFEDLFKEILTGAQLDVEKSQEALRLILDPNTPDAQIAGFLSLLSYRGPNSEEIAGMSNGMLEASLKIEGLDASGAVDTCGTGGDGLGIFNVSTTVALIIASLGVPVIKHGNRAASSKCGSADVLSELGVIVDLSPQGVKYCIEEVGIGFCFAPRFHATTKRVAAIRQQLKIPTIFNILGPLSNPAFPGYQIIGVNLAENVDKMANVLQKRRWIKRAAVYCGEGPIDEISTEGDTLVALVNRDSEDESNIEHLKIGPKDFGLDSFSVDLIKGGNPSDNALIVREILDNKGSRYLDAALMNTAFGLYVIGVASNFREGMEIASEAISSGRAQEILEKFVEVSRIARDKYLD